MPSALRWSVLLSILSGVFAAGALAGSICHPDPAGTRTARVNGSVQHYTMRGGTVAIAYRVGDACRQIQWRIFGALTSPRGAADCARTSRLSAGGGRVTLVRGGPDEPDRLVVRSRGARHAWPLPERPSSLDAFGPTAVFSSDREVYTVGLNDGRVALVGPSKRGDTPQIEAPGVVYQGNLYKRYERAGWTRMKFIPSVAVSRMLANVGKPVDLPGRIEGFSMDGNRIAVGVRPRGECASILFWNVAWRYTAWISDDDELTCKLTGRGGEIRDVAIGGARAEWTIRSGSFDRVVSASSWACIDRVAATARRSDGGAASVSGDASTLAYAVRSDRGRSWSLGAIGGRMRSTTLVTEAGVPLALAADGNRMAVLKNDGSVELRAHDGTLLTTLDGVEATAISLRADQLVALTRAGRLAVFDLATGTLRHSWALPAGADNKVDAHFGVAVVTAGGNVYAISLRTGRIALVASAVIGAQAAIEAPGIAYGYNSGSRGSLRFIPFARVEAALR
jgi:hypothetical protein